MPIRAPDTGTVTVTEREAERVAAAYFGLRGAASALHGERDRNFLLRAPDGRAFLVKVANPEDDRAILELQNAALAHLDARRCAAPVPRVVLAADGSPLIESDVAGVPRLVRVFTWLPGAPLAATRPRSPRLLRCIGEALGRVTAGLADFRHPAASRPLRWDLREAGWIRGHLDALPAGQRDLVARTLEAFDALGAELDACRSSVVHNDANDHNILVEFDEAGEPRIGGVIDFGDIVETPVVCDVAITLAYAMMDQPDPIAAAADVVAGYHGAFALDEREVPLLLPLARTRLAVSIVNAALQQEREPGNAYHQVSAAPARRLLERLSTANDRLATCRLRAACGFEASPTGADVRAWMSRAGVDVVPVVELPLDDPGVMVLDLSVASGDIGLLDEWRDAAAFTRRLFGQMRDAGRRVAIGRYDEVRALYTSDVFRETGNEGPEWRALHIGVDIFVAAGAPVFAPLAGRVHSLADNANPLDYGPTVILEHAVDNGRLTFWTLYGHLSRETLAHLAPGDAVAAGARIGWLGDETVNGGWPPHLHFQVITDLFDRQGDFPGVARVAERDTWLSVSPDPSPLLRLGTAARAPRTASVPALRERRTARIGRSLSVSYRRPLHIVRGVMQHLVDADGRRYLDAVNNVAHVGHAHPDVVRAGQRQMAVLNTNTRYLHEHLEEYAERLTATLPEPLRVCFFTNSGSEANELALRLARAHTAERDLVVLEAGYHGNTSTLVEVSPYKFDGPGGAGAPPWVQQVPMPDTYRGPFRRDDEAAGLKYAQAVRDAVGRIRRAGRRPSALLAESVLSCGGQVVLPPGYLAEAYRHIRAAGGVCIADEVQVGLGRVGSHWWGFETQGVVPDIVTMGKPIGNGHPLGAVVTTPEIAASFANGMEYFNTFGGNPVSCAIGLAVLDVIGREGLQERARVTGAALMDGLHALQSRWPLVGDVRGLGLFIGVELVTDPDVRTPAARQASYVANRMRDLGVLMSTDGPDNNVLKIKPPLVFDERDAGFLVDTMARVLAEDPARPGFMGTPGA